MSLCHTIDCVRLFCIFIPLNSLKGIYLHCLLAPFLDSAFRVSFRMRTTHVLHAAYAHIYIHTYIHLHQLLPLVVEINNQSDPTDQKYEIIHTHTHTYINTQALTNKHLYAPLQSPMRNAAHTVFLSVRPSVRRSFVVFINASY